MAATPRGFAASYFDGRLFGLEKSIYNWIEYPEEEEMKTVTVGLMAAVVILWSAQLVRAESGDATAGKASFAKSCSACHGADGNSPKEAIAKMLKAEIPQLGSPAVQALTDADIKKRINEGGVKMKPVKGLSDKDVNNIIAFVRTIPKP
jgi:cytochrome c553